MHTVQGYCRRLSTEKLQQLLRNHQEGLEKQCDEVIELVNEILREREVNEQEHPGS